jgi:hypothetical protein
MTEKIDALPDSHLRHKVRPPRKIFVHSSAAPAPGAARPAGGSVRG